MSSSAEVLLLLAVAVPGDTTPPPAVVAQVADAIAARWAVAADSLQLTWGRLPVLPGDLSHATIRLGGTGRDGWFVATILPDSGRAGAVTVRAGLARRLPVAARPLGPGALLGLADVRWERRVAWGPPGEAGTRDGPVGWQVRRSVAAGDVLEAPLVEPPRVVQTGEPVTFVWERGAVHLERVGTAQGAARVGELVRAQVGDTRLVGRVTGPGVAVIEGSPP